MVKSYEWWVACEIILSSPGTGGRDTLYFYSHFTFDLWGEQWAVSYVGVSRNEQFWEMSRLCYGVSSGQLAIGDQKLVWWEQKWAVMGNEQFELWGEQWAVSYVGVSRNEQLWEMSSFSFEVCSWVCWCGQNEQLWKMSSLSWVSSQVCWCEQLSIPRLLLSLSTWSPSLDGQRGSS